MMTEVQVPSLTPPTKAKKERKAKDPSAPAKPRAPRQNYGYRPDAVIELVAGKEIKYRDGNRKAWYDSIAPFAGRTVKEWEESRKGEKDAPRGWLRFFVQDGAVVLKAQEVAQAA
jgi:hypothetical protein